MKKINFIIIVPFLLSFSVWPTSDNSSLSAVTLVQAGTQTSNKSIKVRMCSTITDFLEDKIIKTKKGSNTSKILQGSLKYTNKVCGEGQTPDLNKVTEGLNEKDKKILNTKLRNSLSRFYDGTGNLPDEDFDDIKTKSSKTGSGKTGVVIGGDTISDLKSSDPNLKSFRTNPESNVPPIKTAKAQSMPAAVLSSDPQIVPSTAPSTYYAGLIEMVQSTERELCKRYEQDLNYENETKTKVSNTIPEEEQRCRDMKGDKRNCECGVTWMRYDLRAIERKIPRITSEKEVICNIPEVSKDIKGFCIVIKRGFKIDQMRMDNFSTEIEKNNSECPSLCKEWQDTCLTKTKDLERDRDVLNQSVELAKQQMNILCKEEPETQKCPTECNCTIVECKDVKSGINSRACLVACKAAKPQPICIPIMDSCPKGWNDTYWKKPPEPVVREEGKLLPDEIAEAEKIFGDKIDYKKIKIETGADMTEKGKKLTKNLDPGESVTLGYTIYFPNDEKGKSTYNFNFDWDKGVFIHEMTHIYQKDNYSGWSLWWGKRMDWLRGKIGTRYKYDLPFFTLDPKTGEMVPAKSFRDYGLDQQAEIVRTYYNYLLLEDRGAELSLEDKDKKKIIESMLRKERLMKPVLKQD